MIGKIIFLFLILFSTTNLSGIVNLSHLDFLKEDRVGMSVVWLYSDYPKYERLRDPGEGVACVDDNARAIVTYCRYYEITGDTNALEKAKNICEFIKYMRYDSTPKYVNFIWEDGSRNETGNTSRPAFGSYAARACMGFGYAFKTFKKSGIATYTNYANNTLNTLIDEFNVAFHNFDYNQWINIHGYSFKNIPMDNAHNCGTALLGLLAWKEAGAGGSWVDDNVNWTCNNLIGWQFGDINTFPFSAILTKRDNVTWFQGYGAYHIAALAYAAGIYNNSNWLQVAKKTADNFYSIYLTSIYPGNEGRNPTIIQFPQIAFAISPIVEGYYRIYEASKKLGEPPDVYLKYAKYAGLFASFFMGNNIYGIPTYNSNTGICFDGLESPENPAGNRINRNSGGESTVETLNALLLVLSDTNCRPYVYAKEIKRHSPLLLEAEDADEVYNGEIVSDEWFGDFISGQMFSKSKYLELNPGGKMKITFYTENDYNDLSDNYLVYLCYAKRTSGDNIKIKIDNYKSIFFNTGGSPDSDFLFYEKLTNQGMPAVFNLPPGRHTIEIEAGTEKLILDQIVIQPVIQRKSFKLQDGTIINVDRPFITNANIPSVPQNTAITPVDYGNTLRIEWATKEGVYGYNIYRKSDIEPVYSKINFKPVTKNYYIDNGLIAGRRYYYRVTSISNYTWVESSLTNASEVSGIPLTPLVTKMPLTETEYEWNLDYSGVYFISELYNNFAETKIYEVDIDKYPDIQITINNPSDTYWSLNILRWIPDGSSFFTFEEIPLQSQTRNTGIFNYNLKSLFGWSGTKLLKLRFSLSKNNISTFLKELKFYNAKTKEVFYQIKSPRLFFPYDGNKPDYYIPEISFNVNSLNKKISCSGNVNIDNFELIISKLLTADFNYYKGISFKINSINDWSLLAVVDDNEYTIVPYNKKTGSFHYDISSIPGISGLKDIELKFKIKTGSSVLFEISDPCLTTSPVPVFYENVEFYSIPNPFTPLSDDERFNRITFYFPQKANEKSKITIFAIDGRIIKEIENAVSGKTYWDGKDESGNYPPSGLYIYQITLGNEKKYKGSILLIK